MIPGVKFEITLKDNTTGQSVTVPVLPINGALSYVDGDQQPISVNILDLGTVEIPAGVALDSCGWDSLFPAQHDPSYCAVGPGQLRKPVEYRNMFSAWKDAGTSLQLICPAANLNKTVYLKSFSWTARGAEGDLYYSVLFTEYRKLAPKKVAIGGTLRSGPTPADRPPMPATPKPQTYTVQSGDTLSLIGKKLGINWKTIYENNKAVIGANPNVIIPGQVLKI
jgi:hypothetical protein